MFDFEVRNCLGNWIIAFKKKNFLLLLTFAILDFLKKS